MTTFTSSLPDHILELLEKKAKELAIPKNKLIEKALSLYLEHLNRAEYIRSYKKMKQDSDLMILAEEGLTDYLHQIENEAR